MQPLSKDEILRGYNRGEEKARGAVYTLYHDALLITVSRMTGDSSGAEDLVNDTFVEFYKEPRNFNEISDLRNFLFETAKNLCINTMIKRKKDEQKQEALEQRFQYSEEKFDADIAYAETRSLIFHCVERLPDKLRPVFRLRFFSDLTNEEVALKLKIAAKTVGNRYTEARQQLKWDLEKVQKFTIYLLNLLL
jgi:RNA polymerase sigma factor (sigma-70 family)